MILCYNISGASRNSAIYKLVIVRIFLNQIEIKIDIDKSCVWTTYDCIYDILCCIFICQQIENFLVFIQYGSCNTQEISTVKETVPNFTIRAP